MSSDWLSPISIPYLGVFAGSIPIFLGICIKLFRPCTERIKEKKRSEIMRINATNDPVTITTVVDIFKKLDGIDKKYSRINSYITYSFWSGISLTSFSLIGGVSSSYLNFNSSLMLIPVVLSGCIFAINLIPLLWWYIKS